MSEQTSILNSVPGFGNIYLKLSPENRIRLATIAKRVTWLRDDLEREYERKTGRNDLCPCGSGKKYKKCCGSSSSYG
jgi:hypothetical protein